MKLWAVKVSKRLAENTLRLLRQAGFINPDARIQKDCEYILIPLTGQPNITDLEDMVTLKNNFTILEAEFEAKKVKPSLEDMLGFSPAFDVIGDIAVIDSEDPEARRIAKTLMDFRKSIKVVLGGAGPVSGEFRTRDFVVLAGEHRTHTVHTEYGCRYKMDLTQVYFSPRLGTERMRVAETVKAGQCVLDLFAGVGPFSILIGKKVPDSRVVAVDKNPIAVQFLRENIRLNRLDNITAVENDAREAAHELEHWADHVIMNLPHSARDFLDSGMVAVKSGGIVHFYDITHEDDLFDTSWGLIQESANRMGKKAECVEKRIVRSYAPYKYNICIEFRVVGD